MYLLLSNFSIVVAIQEKKKKKKCIQYEFTKDFSFFFNQINEVRIMKMLSFYILSNDWLGLFP